MPRLKQQDKMTSDNTVTSEGALRLLGKLPDNYDMLPKDEQQRVKENRIRKLKELEQRPDIELKRFKTDGSGWKYFKSQCERLFEMAAIGEITL